MARPSSPYSTPIFGWRTPEEYDIDYWTEFCSMLSTMEGDVGSVWNAVSSHSATYWNSVHTTVSANSANWGGSYEEPPIWDDSTISYDSGWFNLPIQHANNLRIAHGIGSEPDIAFLWAKGWSDEGDQIFTACMGMGYGGTGVGIVELGATNVTVHGNDPTIKFSNRYAAGGGDHFVYTPDLRVLCITKTPDYSSGWVAVPALGTQATLPHGIGSIPDFYTLEIRNASDHGYSMAGHYIYTSGIGFNIVDVDAVNIVISVGAGGLADYYDYSNTHQDINAVAGWSYKVKAWSWTPDYTSPWTYMGTAAGVYHVTFKHDLERIPFLYLLEFSKANDGSDDIVPMMAPSQVNANTDYGVHLQDLGDRFATVRYDHVAGRIACYEDSGGGIQLLTSGYVRLKLWT